MGQWTKERHDKYRWYLSHQNDDAKQDERDMLAEIERGWAEIERLTAPVDVEAEVRVLFGDVESGYRWSTGEVKSMVRPLVADRARLAREVRRLDGVVMRLRALPARGATHHAFHVYLNTSVDSRDPHPVYDSIDADEAKLAATEAQLAQVATESDRAEQALRAQITELSAERDTAIAGADKLAAVQALLAAYDAGDHAEGRPSPSWLVGQIREAIGDGKRAESLDAEHGRLAVKEVLRTITEPEAQRLVDVRAAMDRETEARIATAAPGEARERLRKYVHAIATGHDCDTDAHKHNTGCYVCEAKELDRALAAVEPPIVGVEAHDRALLSSALGVPVLAPDEVTDEELADVLRRLADAPPRSWPGDLLLRLARAEQARRTQKGIHEDGVQICDGYEPGATAPDGRPVGSYMGHYPAGGVLAADMIRAHLNPPEAPEMAVTTGELPSTKTPHVDPICACGEPLSRHAIVGQYDPCPGGGGEFRDPPAGVPSIAGPAGLLDMARKAGGSR